MSLTLIPAIVLGLQAPILQPPRLRTVLPNGAAVIVERMPNAKSLSVQLFISARGTQETLQTNGLRHLLEHIVARGKDRTLDTRLETAGGFLQARTYRDAMAFEVTVPTTGLKTGLEALSEVMRMPRVSREEITKEARIIDHERAIRPDSALLAASAWEQAFGDKGLDTQGNPDTLAAATFEDLAKTHRQQMVGKNLVVAIAGDVGLDDATRQAVEILGAIPKGTAADTYRGKGKPGVVESPGRGEARAALVGPYRDPVTAAALAAGLAVASELEDAFVTYTPSNDSSLIVVGRTERNGTVGAAFSAAKAEALFSRGRALARRWVERQFENPSSVASARGLLLVQSVALRPETLLENLDSMTLGQFRKGLAAYADGEAVVVEGAR